MKELLKSKIFAVLATLAIIGAVAIPLLSGTIIHSHAASLPPLNEVKGCLQPPQNVNLMTLSDTQLESYGLPNHATLDSNPRKWTRLLSESKHHVCGFTTARSLSSPNVSQASCPAPSSACNSTFWAGNEAQGSRSTFTEASVEFNVPSIPTSPTNAEVALWAGVGGDPSITSGAVLVQVGLVISLVQVQSHYVQYNETFWEVVPGFTITNLNLNQGIAINDDLYFDVGRTPLTGELAQATLRGLPRGRLG